MAEAERITARQRAILTAIVESYIETGEPVGSGTIAGTIARVQAGAGFGLSPATVRNEMAELANEGLLEQPHTSAGRVPTARAFRMYVERLSEGAGMAGARLLGGARPEIESQRLQLESRIDSSFAGVSGTQAMLERTSHVLATVSSGVGVAVAAVAGGDTLEHVHFSRLAKGRVLAVVVTQSGLVRDRVLALEGGVDADLTARELEAAANFLNEHFRGWSIERVRAEIGRLVERERSEYQRQLSSVEQLWAGAVPENGELVQTVYVEGVANLLGGHAGGSAGDIARLKEVLAALEAKQRLVELLNAYIDAKQESVRVIFDLEEHAPEMAGLVLIAAPARMAGEGRGTVGVIGPKRIHYENTMNAVSYIAQVFERMLHPSA
jgi:heat-inducible transcriptional repressor